MPEPFLAVAGGVGSTLGGLVTFSSFVYDLKNAPADVTTFLALVARVDEDLKYVVDLRDKHLKQLQETPTELKRLDDIVRGANECILDIGRLLEKCRREAHGGKVPLLGRMRFVLGDSTAFLRRTGNLQQQHAAINVEINHLRTLSALKPITDLVPNMTFENSDLLSLNGRNRSSYRLPIRDDEDANTGKMSPPPSYTSHTASSSSISERASISHHLSYQPSRLSLMSDAFQDTSNRSILSHQPSRLSMVSDTSHEISQGRPISRFSFLDPAQIPVELPVSAQDAPKEPIDWEPPACFRPYDPQSPKSSYSEVSTSQASWQRPQPYPHQIPVVPRESSVREASYQHSSRRASELSSISSREDSRWQSPIRTPLTPPTTIDNESRSQLNTQRYLDSISNAAPLQRWGHSSQLSLTPSLMTDDQPERQHTRNISADTSITTLNEPHWKAWKPPLPVPPKPVGGDQRNQLPSQRQYVPPANLTKVEADDDVDPEVAYYRDMRMQAEERQRRREERMGLRS